MKRLKKTVRILGLVFAMCFILFVLDALWDGMFAYILPWTRTRFPDYQSYDSFLMKYKCCDYFVSELPMGATEPKYYWHHESWEAFAS